MEFVLSTSKIFSALLLVFLLLNCFTFDSQVLLPPDEVQTLKTIFEKLHNNYSSSINQNSCSPSTDLNWNITDLSNVTCDCSITVNSPDCNVTNTFSQNSCSQSSGLNVNITTTVIRNVICSCSFDTTDCHVTKILLKGLNLTGVLPVEFGTLTYLREIDLSRNYINGSIPESLAQLPNLTILSLFANRISGNITEKIGNINTLEELVLEDNQLDGPLPQSLGNLSELRRLLLSGNNFIGIIPETFSNLTNLTDFGIDGSSLSGKIPDFIGNWTNIKTLSMRGTSMEGPIPSTISLLNKTQELRISDLNGSSITSFPDLKNMKDLKRLELRNCFIVGSIPEYIGELTNLKLLDLSFNKLTGPIPTKAEGLDENINYFFLGSNSLSGELPSWISKSRENFDVSYNNFSGPAPASCQQLNVNSVSSYSSLETRI